MKRRNFLKTSIIAGSVFFNTDNLIGFHNNNVADSLLDNSIDPLIPVRIFSSHEEKIIEQLIELNTNYGFKRFLILAPDKTVRFSGFPPSETYNEIGKLILRIKRKLAPYNIEIGWECSATIKQGPGAPYQYLTGIDGRVSEISFCPLDPGFRKALSTNIATVVSIAHPFMVVMEDDFTLSHAGFGCFCPYHLAEFNKKLGSSYTREELLDIFSTVTPDSIQLRREWALLSKDSLASLAGLIRQKVDEFAPETRILLCQPGSADIQGDMTEAVTKAFAGKTRPAVRLYGTDYGHDHPEVLPNTIFHVLYCSQRLPTNFELFHESDTFPHTRFFVSSAKIKSLMTAAFAYGVDDARFHPVQNTDNLLEEVGYLNMFKHEVQRFNTLKKAVKNCRVEGCEIMYDPFEHVVSVPGRGNKRYAWANVTGRLGIPHTSSGGRVKMISGSTVELLGDDDITKLLSGSVFLDGKAALSLSKRGFSDLIGATVIEGGQPKFMYEGIRDNSGIKDITGKIMYNFLIFVVATEGGEFVELQPLNNAKVITDFLDGEEKAVTPGIITYENRLGGRVAITAFDLNNNSSSAVINYKKKEILSQTIEWLGKEPLPVFIKNAPNVFCIFNRSKSNDYAIVVIISLCSDPFDSITLEVAPEWLNSNYELLDFKGTWNPVKVEIKDRTIKLNTRVTLMNPLIIKFSKKG
ncbi:MAG: hypothetical protein ACOX19_12500 [Fermentimonas sp.]